MLMWKRHLDVALKLTKGVHWTEWIFCSLWVCIHNTHLLRLNMDFNNECCVTCNEWNRKIQNNDSNSSGHTWKQCGTVYTFQHRIITIVVVVIVVDYSIKIHTTSRSPQLQLSSVSVRLRQRDRSYVLSVSCCRCRCIDISRQTNSEIFNFFSLFSCVEKKSILCLYFFVCHTECVFVREEKRCDYRQS